MSRDVGRCGRDWEATASWVLPHLESTTIPLAKADAPTHPPQRGPQRGGNGHVKAMALVKGGRHGTAANSDRLWKRRPGYRARPARS